MALELNILENGEFSFSGRSMQITKEKNALLVPYCKILSNYGKVICLLPDNEQMQCINQQIGNARFVRNDYLNERIRTYKESEAILTVSEYKKNYLPKLKEANDFLKLSDKFALESAIENVDDAYKHFYDNLKKKVKNKKGQIAGFPKFASKFKPNGNRYTTKYTNGNIKLLEKDGVCYLQLPKVGKVQFVLPAGETLKSILPKNTRITSASIQRNGNKYEAAIQLEAVIDMVEEVNTVHYRDLIASDMGIKDFAIYGNCDFTEKVDNPRFIKLHEKRVRRLSKSLSRKIKGSKNYEKAKLKLSKEHRKIKNQRKDFHHKLSRKIADQCIVFICEDLNIKGIVKNRHLSKEVSSAGWGQFLTYLKYKMERKGGLFVKVDRFYASSKICHVCGHKNSDLKLKDRDWICPDCKAHHDRDINAKYNLLNEGIRILKDEFNIKVIH